MPKLRAPIGIVVPRQKIGNDSTPQTWSFDEFHPVEVTVSRSLVKVYDANFFSFITARLDHNISRGEITKTPSGSMDLCQRVEDVRATRREDMSKWKMF